MYNPAGIQQSVLAVLDQVTNGTMNIVDPTSPFLYSLESSAVLTAGFMQENAANTRKLYPMAAQTPSDLYTHMSDLDYLNRFAVPATASFFIILPLAQLLSKMVTDPATGINMVVIPRNSYFTVADTTFSIQYPIQIRQMQHGGISVVYDTTITSPMQQLDTNVIPYELLTNNDGTEWIRLQFETYQFDIISQTGSLDASTDFSIDISFTDQYYFCRVYTQNLTTGLYTEIVTTHTDQIYDPTIPTAVLTVTAKSINVTIPQIYTSTSLLNSGIRIDVYETKGILNMILWEYPIGSCVGTWEAYDPNDQTIFTAPLPTLTTVVIYSDDAVSGGKNAMTFTQLRQQVITNAIGAPSLPITNTQIETALAVAGYTIVKNVDSITNRIYLATRPMPTPINTALLTAASASIETVSIVISAIATNTAIIDNGTSITLTPNVIYQNNNGIVTVVPSSQVAALQALSPSSLAVAVSSGNFLYTPFHYVLDMANNEFNMRPYYLDDPVINTKLFVAENDSTLIQVGTQAYSISRTNTGFSIQIVTQSTSVYQSLPDNEVYAQLSFTPEGETANAFINGVQTGTTSAGERIYTFDLSTNFYLDINNNIGLTKFFMFTDQSIVVYAGLNTIFNVLYATTSVMGSQWSSDSVDTNIGKFLLPNNAVGITQEQLNVTFGYALTTLWAEARSVVSSEQYETYTANVPWTYQADVYTTDNNGSSINIVNGQVVYNILHHAGDPVLETNGTPSYQHLAGDTVLDSNGNPVITNARGMMRMIDLMMIEGAYWFATDSVSTGYRTDLTRTVVGWLTEDLVVLSTDLLENTELLFYPATSLGQINVNVGNSVIVTLEAGQVFVVNLFVPNTTLNNLALRANIETTTIQVISAALTATTISIDQIVTSLRAQYGTDVTSVQLSGFGGSLNYQAVIIEDAGANFSIAKRLVAQADNSLIVEEAVTINFIPLN